MSLTCKYTRQSNWKITAFAHMAMWLIWGWYNNIILLLTLRRSGESPPPFSAWSFFLFRPATVLSSRPDLVLLPPDPPPLPGALVLALVSLVWAAMLLPVALVLSVAIAWVPVVALTEALALVVSATVALPVALVEGVLAVNSTPGQKNTKI